ncbi:MAG: hypothetical protein HY613_08350 [Candidatus Rokubacteria bacterium]|nr:hypothetical protein [Candidatus Rokubacteria bacterium]
MAVTSWPRSLAWSEFTEISVRPSGVSENGQISVTTDLPTSGIRVIREGSTVRIGDIEVPLVVHKTESWVVTGTKTDDLLSHEQGHFDIAGLVAWELYRRIMATRAPNAADLQRQINEHVARARRKLHGLSGSSTEEGKYDTETAHGTNAAEQRRWKDLIRESITHDYRALPNP